MSKQSRLLTPNSIYKPFHYPWAYKAWLTQQQIHWLPEEVPLAEDVKDWNRVLNEKERNLLMQIFRFFTQADVEVGGIYTNYYLRVFQPTEIRMMLAAFANMETIHMAAYADLLDTVGMPEAEYEAFMHYKEMREKWEFIQKFGGPENRDIAKTLAIIGAFVEGLQLFASFAILMNFPRFNKMKGMGQIVTWSVRDETLHVHSSLNLLHAFIEENPEVWDEKLKNEIVEAGIEVVKHEDAFIDLAFELGGVDGMEASDIKSYIRYIADRRFEQLKLDPVYGITVNPLPWMDEILNGLEHTNFFENRSTEYSKAATKGTWDDAFGE